MCACSLSVCLLAQHNTFVCANMHVCPCACACVCLNDRLCACAYVRARVRMSGIERFRPRCISPSRPKRRKMFKQMRHTSPLGRRTAKAAKTRYGHGMKPQYESPSVPSLDQSLNRSLASPTHSPGIHSLTPLSRVSRKCRLQICVDLFCSSLNRYARSRSRVCVCPFVWR